VPAAQAALGRPKVDRKIEDAIRGRLSAGEGMLRVSKALGVGVSEVARVSWTPDYLGSRSPRWARQGQPTRLSSVVRLSSWCAPVAHRRSWHASSSRRHSRSGTGLRNLHVMLVAVMAA
jgi:hypothetical protein